jgi:hypothetical protein
MSAEGDSRIELLVKQKMDGKSYSTIREELAESGMPEEEIKKLIRQVDERVLSETMQNGTKEKVRLWYRIGLIVAIGGLVLSIAYNVGFALRGFPAWAAYSPFFVGIVVMIYARALQRKQSDPPDTGTGAIRKRRPYK